MTQAQKEKVKQQQRAYRNDPTGKICYHCKKQATKWDLDNWMCQPCLGEEARKARNITSGKSEECWLFEFIRELEAAMDRFWEVRGIPEPKIVYMTSRERRAVDDFWRRRGVAEPVA
jgi:hypothetical protein